MKRTLFALFALIVFAVSTGVMPARAVDVQKVVSPGGIEAWLVEDHTNPVIALEARFTGGSAMDPDGKEGLSNLVSGLLDEGAGDLTSFEFQSKLEDLAIRLSFSDDRDAFTAHLMTLTENKDEAAHLLGLALTQPRFDAEPVERVRAQILTGLAQADQDPGTLASRAWFETVFAGHPYAKRTKGTAETVKAITVEDLKAFAKRRFGKDNLLIGVSGDIAPQDLGSLLDTVFGALPATSEPVTVPKTTVKADGSTKVIEVDVPQSTVTLGQGSLLRTDPDWYTAYALNYILGGGGFNSRLMEEVREKRGLAYSVYSYLYPFAKAGTWIGGVATENARVKQSVDLIRAEWKRMAEEGPTEKELTDAKTYLTGAWPLQLNGTAKIAGILVGMQMYDLGMDYLNRRNDFVEAITMDDIKRVAKRLLKPDALTVVVAGKPEGLVSQ